MGTLTRTAHSRPPSLGRSMPTSGGVARKRWFLYFGGVANGDKTHAEAIGVATSLSPFGPWTKSPLNPVVTMEDVSWCGEEGAARVDEMEP